MTEWSQVPAVARPLPEPEPQPVLATLTAAAIFLVLMIEPGGEDAVRDLLADWAGLARAVGFRVPEAPLACVAGVSGADLKKRIDAIMEERLGVSPTIATSDDPTASEKISLHASFSIDSGATSSRSAKAAISRSVTCARYASRGCAASADTIRTAICDAEL